MRSRLTWLSASLLAIGAATACSTTAGSLLYTPVTGVVVQSEPLTAETGCGREAGQVVRYLARIEDACGRILFARDYDCFADATFVNLPPSRYGSSLYFLRIYAFDDAAYAANAAAIQTAVTPIGAGVLARTPFAALTPTYVASCTSAQSTDVQSPAVCQPLHVPGAEDTDTPPDPGYCVDPNADAGTTTAASGSTP